MCVSPCYRFISLQTTALSTFLCPRKEKVAKEKRPGGHSLVAFRRLRNSFVGFARTNSNILADYLRKTPHLVDALKGSTSTAAATTTKKDNYCMMIHFGCFTTSSILSNTISPAFSVDIKNASSVMLSEVPCFR